MLNPQWWGRVTGYFQRMHTARGPLPPSDRCRQFVICHLPLSAFRTPGFHRFRVVSRPAPDHRALRRRMDIYTVGFVRSSRQLVSSSRRRCSTDNFTKPNHSRRRCQRRQMASQRPRPPNCGGNSRPLQRGQAATGSPNSHRSVDPWILALAAPSASVVACLRV